MRGIGRVSRGEIDRGRIPVILVLYKVEVRIKNEDEYLRIFPPRDRQGITT